LYRGPGGILESFNQGNDAANVSHQYTIASLINTMMKSRFNPFRASTKDVGAAVKNGSLHLMVVSMSPDGSVKVLEAGYLQQEWVATRLAEGLEEQLASPATISLSPSDPQRLGLEQATAYARAGRDVMTKRPDTLQANAEHYIQELQSARDPGTQATFRQALEATLVGLRQLGTEAGWTAENAEVWANRLAQISGLQPSSGEQAASKIVAAYLSDPSVKNSAKKAVAELKTLHEQLSSEKSTDSGLEMRRQRQLEHLKYLIELLGEEADAALVQRWREAARGAL
jgi:hypothetical protein